MVFWALELILPEADAATVKSAAATLMTFGVPIELNLRLSAPVRASSGVRVSKRRGSACDNLPGQLVGRILGKLLLK